MFPIFQILDVVLPIVRAVRAHPAATTDHHDLAADAHDVGSVALALGGVDHLDAATGISSMSVRGLNDTKKADVIQRALGLADRARALFPDAAPSAGALDTLQAALAAFRAKG